MILGASGWTFCSWFRLDVVLKLVVKDTEKLMGKVKEVEKERFDMSGLCYKRWFDPQMSK